LIELLDVSGFSEPKFDENMIENLVMDEKRVKMLKALAKSYARLNKHEEKSELDMWSADFVKGKGNGLTFLLHGTPGVGKTCTAGKYRTIITHIVC
jgi:signal recognition particle GTPase